MTIKMSSRPPLPKSAVEFIEAAEKNPLQREVKELPWLSANVRPDVKRPITLLLHEPCLLKLKFIGENSTHSQQSFAREILEKAIDDMIIQLGY